MYPRQQGLPRLQEAKRPATQEPFVGPSSFGSESLALEGWALAQTAGPTNGFSEGAAVGIWLGLTEGFALGKELGLFLATVDSVSPKLGASVVPGAGGGFDKPVTPVFGNAVISTDAVSTVGGLVSISLLSILLLAADSVSVGSPVAENVVARALFTEVG